MSGPGGSSRDGEPSWGWRRRRKGRLVAVSLLLAALAIAGGVTWALFDSSVFAVRSVVVTGTRLVPESTMPGTTTPMPSHLPAPVASASSS